MAKLGINTGSSPNDGLGDSLLAGAIKINSNFNEIYNAIGNGTSITNTIAFANTAFSLSGSPNINVGFATVSNLDVGIAGSSLIVTNDGIIAIGTDSTLYDLEIFQKDISIYNSNITAAESFLFVSSLESSQFFASGAYISGIITATSYNGDGSSLSGVITSILAGNNISIAQTDGTITIDAIGGGSGESYWGSNASGIHTLSNVGLGKTNPTYDLDVVGDINYTGTLYKNGSAFLSSRWDAGTGTNIYKLSGNVGIGSTLPQSKLTVANGNISIAGTGNLTLPTLNRITLGDAGQNDSSMYFDGSDLRIDSPIQIRLGTGTYNYITATSGSSVNLYYGSGDKKLETTNTGIDVTGNIVLSGDLRSSGIVTGSNLYASGSIYGYGKNITGIVTSLIAGQNVTLSSSDGQVTIDVSQDSAWQATFVGISTLSNVGIGTTNPTSKLSVSGIANINGGLEVIGVTSITNGRIQFGTSGENVRIGYLAGGSGGVSNISIGDRALFAATSSASRNIGLGQFSLYNITTGRYNIAIGDRSGENVSTGSSNVIIGSYNGNSGGLDIRTSNNNIVLSDGSGIVRQYINSSGNVGFGTVNPTSRLTVNGNVLVSGILTATIPASNLTGALPAIDGSALIGVVGSGSGVIIEDDATPVGTAGTINFGSNLSVSFASGTATISGASSVSEATTAYELAGTPNLNVGVVTAIGFSGPLTGNVTGDVSGNSSTAGYATSAGISSAVSANININTSGIITASSFSGSASGLTNIPASQLTGALPAIDGSALTGVVASGTGIVIRDDGSLIGTAGTINFGTGISVSPVSAGVVTVTSSSGSLSSRTTVTGITTSIPNNGIGNTNITGFRSYALLRVGLSTAAWLRLYTDSTSRANDSTRSQGVDPIPGSGVIAEVVTTGISTTQIISPFVMGGNLDNPVGTTIYASVTNLSGVTTSISVNLTLLQLEA